MKRIGSLLLVLVMIMASNSFAFAKDENDYNVVKEALEKRGLWGKNFELNSMFDAAGTEKYLLGTTDCGYIILEKDSFTFHEAGEGNPYYRYMSEDKYYGGPMCYFVTFQDKNGREDYTADQYYDIVHEHFVSEVIELDRIAGEAIEESIQTRGISSVSSTKVTNYISYIKRRSFGWNSGSYSNTCSAVALGQALNYYAQQYEDEYVPSNWMAELRTAVTEQPSSYPKAVALHHYLVDTCDMTGPCYGASLVSGFMVYKNNKIPSTCNISLSWTLSPAINTVKNKINSNLPVLITTSVANPDPAYNYHTMIVYGYRVVDGVTEYLVHNGWYDSAYNNYANGKHTQIDVWYSPMYATYGYYFTLS